MNNSDFKEQAEKYRQQMMKLYGDNTPAKPVIQQEVQESPPIQQTDMDTSEAKDSAIEQIEERFPIPEIPDFIRNNTAQINDSYGYLKVSVKTGNGGIPLENSLVSVSEIKDGKEHIIRMLTTDSSGNTETIRLPAPGNSKGNTPSSYNSFAKYNISAFSNGYFRETSVDAPVFSGITSVQTFYLIPEPFDYNSGERTIVDRNTEPIF